ncbi:MAG TPA: metallophosphoesterase [Candidatus Acidoferrum sp.]|nr:metallophosphoesterase [Candidatus Acidoferrum sp.]
MNEQFPGKQHDRIQADHSGDGIDRRGFLECMAWVGTGLLWTVSGGILSSSRLALAAGEQSPTGAFSFVQISDSHIGFAADANRDVTGTLQLAIDRINALQPAPAFLLHTGDLTHSQKPGEFDTLAENLKSARASQVFYVPGEHDVFADDGKAYLDRYGQGTFGKGWRSFDYQGVHFLGLNNVSDLKAGGLGSLGAEQLEWIEKDVEGLSSSTPIVVFAHIPLWAVYPEWGWGTEDAEQALGYLRRFGSVTVLNGHIHQILQKVEGNVTFHTAMSTAFPQPAPGTAKAPGPMKVPDDQLRKVLGIRQVKVVQTPGPLATIDSTLG